MSSTAPSAEEQELLALAKRVLPGGHFGNFPAEDISGEGQTRAAQDLCSSIPAKRKQHYTAPDCGHYGIFSGRRWRTTICPKIAEFVRSA